MAWMTARKKRSISIPPDLDAEIVAAARAEGMTYSGWLASTARTELAVRAGLDAVAAFERDHGAFTEDEMAEAEGWAAEVAKRSRRSGGRVRRTA